MHRRMRVGTVTLAEAEAGRYDAPLIEVLDDFGGPAKVPDWRRIEFIRAEKD